MISTESSPSSDIKISVVVPIYNVEKYLYECLDSIVNQTLKDIEIILVDDCSTDKSGKIADEYAAKDSRITVIHKEKNEGTLLARKTGALRADGKYTLFIDSDDYYTYSNSLQTAYDLIEKENVDILQFDVDIQDSDEKRKQAYLKNWLNRHTSKLRGKNIIDACFLENKYSWNLFNKIYKTEICKKGYGYAENIHLSNAEDAYTYFLISFFATFFKAIATPRIYTYRKNEGSATVRKELTVKNFQKMSNGKLPADLFERFLISQNSLNEYKQYVKNIKDKIPDVSVINLHKVVSEDASDSFDWLMDNYPIPDVITHMYKVYKGKEAELIGKLFGAKSLQTTGKEVKTIGIFYYRFYQGGVERVISLQIPMFINLGYKIVLFTEEYNADEEYDLPKEVKRVTLPKNYSQKRAEVFFSQVKENNVDLMLYHQAISGNLLFDLLLIKSQGIPFVITRHEPTIIHIIWRDNYINLPYQEYRLADKLVVLSKMEESYYRLMGVNAQYLPNPVDIPKIKTDYTKNEGIIIWVGRLEKAQKNYDEALEIMAQVVKQRNKARMIMLGAGWDSNSTEKVKQFIEKNNLENNIQWLGHTLDMDSWYRKAKIHLVTSSFESFPMMMIESKTYGIPMVTYSMPYLELLKDGRGYIEVPQNGIKEAAEAIIKLLDDNELCEKLSMEAQESIEKFKQFDQEKAWTGIIEEVVSSKKEITRDIKINKDDMKLFMETLYFHYGKGAEVINEHKNFSVGKYIKYKILSKLTIGNARKRYNDKYQEQRRLYLSIRGR